MLGFLRRWLGKPESGGSQPAVTAMDGPHLAEREFLELGEDHLGKAAIAKRAAKKAIKERRFDDAWRHLHEQQGEWIQSAAKNGRTKQQTLSLLSSIHEDMANILRLEGSHDEALAHILHCVASSSRPTQTQQKKLASYFRRCKFEGISQDRVGAAVKKLKPDPELRSAQAIVADWRKNRSREDLS